MDLRHPKGAVIYRISHTDGIPAEIYHGDNLIRRPEQIQNWVTKKVLGGKI